MFVFQKAQLLDNEGMTLFALNQGGVKLDLGGFSLESVALDLAAARFDLVMTTALANGRLTVAVEYNTDLFDPGTIDRLLEHFRVLLKGVVADPKQRLSDLPLLTQVEQEQILRRESAGPQDELASEGRQPPVLRGVDERQPGDSRPPLASNSAIEELGDLADEELDGLIASLIADATVDLDDVAAGGLNGDGAELPNQTHAPLDLTQLSDQDLDGLIASLSHSPPAASNGAVNGAMNGATHGPSPILTDLDQLSDAEIESLISLFVGRTRGHA